MERLLLTSVGVLDQTLSLHMLHILEPDISQFIKQKAFQFTFRQNRSMAQLVGIWEPQDFSKLRYRQVLKTWLFTVDFLLLTLID